MKVTLLLINAQSFKSGKDTVADLIAKHIRNTSKVNTKIYCVRFADKLKEWAEQMTGIQREIIPYEHYNDVVSDFTHEQKEMYCSLWDMTLGQLLQKFATEGCRDGFDPQIWCKLLSKEIAQQIAFDDRIYRAIGNKPEKLFFLIPDFRFFNEENLERFIDLNNVSQKTLRIIRPQEHISQDSRDVQHRSETELMSKHQWDFTVLNDKSLVELEQKAQEIAIELIK